MTITAQDVERFRLHYTCLITQSQSSFSRPILSQDLQEIERMEVEQGIDISISKDQLHQLIKDAAFAWAVQNLHDTHPAVVEAWDKYRVVLELSRG